MWLLWGNQERGGLLCRLTFTISNLITAIYWFNGICFHPTLTTTTTKKPIQWHFPFAFTEIFHCIVIKQIHLFHCYSFIWFSPKFCTTSYILYISLITFEESLYLSSSSSADKASATVSCCWVSVTHSATANVGEKNHWLSCNHARFHDPYYLRCKASLIYQVKICYECLLLL